MSDGVRYEQHEPNEMMKVHDPPNRATSSAMWFAHRGLLFDHFVGIAHGAHAHQPLRTVILLAQHGQHVHAGVRLAFQQHHDVVAVHLDADGLLGGHGVGLVRRLVQHGSEAEKLAHRRLIHYHLLLILIHRGHAHRAGHHDVSTPAGIAGLIYALTRQKRQ